MVGLSRPRQNKTVAGLKLDERLKTKQAEARCGVQVIDLRSGDAVHWFRITGIIEELYDVAVLPEVRHPVAIGIKTDEVRRVITVAPGPLDTADEVG